jgi:hypothetical protein
MIQLPDNCAQCEFRKRSPILFDRELRLVCTRALGYPFLDNDWQQRRPAFCPLPNEIISAAVER